MADTNENTAKNELQSSNKPGYPDYHPGIQPGIDYIWGSDQDEFVQADEEEEE